MVCAIGMSLASACEIIYWLTLKLVAKCMVSYNMNLSTRAKKVYKIIFLMVFLAWCTFSYYQFYNVYVAYNNRKYWNKFFNVFVFKDLIFIYHMVYQFISNTGYSKRLPRIHNWTEKTFNFLRKIINFCHILKNHYICSKIWKIVNFVVKKVQIVEKKYFFAPPSKNHLTKKNSQKIVRSVKKSWVPRILVIV